MYQTRRMQSRIPMTLLIRHPHPPWPTVRSRNSSLMGIPMILPIIYITRKIAPKTMNHVGASIPAHNKIQFLEDIIYSKPDCNKFFYCQRTINIEFCIATI